MKAIRIIFGIIVCLAIICFVVYAYYGGLTDVKFQVKQEGGDYLVYQKITGPYKQSGEVIRQINYQLLNEKIETSKSFGIYYDNPKTVEKSKLRSEAGCILETADTAKTYWLRAKFNIKISPIKKYITTEFPLKNSMSIMVSLIKVYPAIEKYVKENNYTQTGSVMEIYDTPNKKILYRIEIRDSGK